jgi:hypothetical protein
VAIAFVALRKGPEAPKPSTPAATPPPIASTPSPAPVAEAAAPAIAPIADAADEAASEDIELDTPTDGGAAAPTGDSGVLDFPDAAEGHRVFMDGKTLGEPFPTEVACGTHVVRVGGKGRDQKIDVPCGGHVLVPYP